MSVLKIRDSASGPWQGITSIQGEPGQKGETGGVNDAVKLALLQIANHVYYDDEHTTEYVQALQDALYPPADLVSLTAAYTPSGPVYDTAELDDLKADLVVAVTKTGGTTQTIAAADYKLYGDLVIGTSTIKVIYRGLIATFDVTVTREPNGLADGTIRYVNRVGEAVSGSATVENNEIKFNTNAGFYYLYLPFLHPISLKAGDVIELRNATPLSAQTTTIGFQPDFNNYTANNDGKIQRNSAFCPWRVPQIVGKATVLEDFKAENVSFYMNGSEADQPAFTLQVRINGEAIF